MRHLVLLQRSPWNMTGRENWVQKLLDNQMEKLFKKLKIPNQANQVQTQIMIELGHPLFAVTQVTLMVPPKHVHLMTARASTLKTKQNMTERGHPLFAMTQVTRNQCLTRLTLTSEHLDCHILLWNKRRTLVFVNWSRRLRTTLTHKLSNEICNKTKPTTRSVQQKMIQDVGNVELFELIETDPETQCKECLSYWSENIVYCTCGHLLKETVGNRSFIEFSLDLLAIPEHVIKKGRPHGHRYGKAPEKQEYHLAHKLKKEMHQEEIHKDLRSFLARSWFSQIHARTWSRWRHLSQMGRSCRTRFTIEKTFWLQQTLPTSNRLHQTENLENDNSGPCPTGSIKNGNRHRVLPPLGGNGVDPGGLPENSKKIDERGCMQSDVIEWCNPLCSTFG